MSCSWTATSPPFHNRFFLLRLSHSDRKAFGEVFCTRWFYFERLSWWLHIGRTTLKAIISCSVFKNADIRIKNFLNYDYAVFDINYVLPGIIKYTKKVEHCRIYREYYVFHEKWGDIILADSHCNYNTDNITKCYSLVLLETISSSLEILSGSFLYYTTYCHILHS